MNKFRRRIMADDSAKKTCLLHGCNLALLGVLLCTTLLAGSQPQANPQDRLQTTELLSYEGQKVSSVELAGQPDLNLAEFMPLVSQQGADSFSADKINRTIDALRKTGKFT